jgi:hypothetical protein
MSKSSAAQNIKIAENITTIKAQDLVIEMIQRGFLKEIQEGYRTTLQDTRARPTSDQVQREEMNSLQQYAPDLEDDDNCPF